MGKIAGEEGGDEEEGIGKRWFVEVGDGEGEGGKCEKKVKRGYNGKGVDL